MLTSALGCSLSCWSGTIQDTAGSVPAWAWDMKLVSDWTLPVWLSECTSVNPGITSQSLGTPFGFVVDCAP